MTDGASERGEDVIARVLRDLGVDARTEDGWVQVSLPDGGDLVIYAEHGASLEASFYPGGK